MRVYYTQPFDSQPYILPGNFRLKAPLSADGKEDWRIVEKDIGQTGASRNQWFKQLNNRYGFMCWRPAWIVEDDKCVPFDTAIEDYYERAYFEYLKKHSVQADYLAHNAHDVYDSGITNTISGTNYYIQGKKSNHYQDIAIRRVLSKLGLHFEGTELIRIRSKSRDPVGRSLSPGRTPFHLPEIIKNDSPVKGWWQEGSIEDFWQKNKVVQASTLLGEMDVRDRLQYATNLTSKS